LNPFLTVLRKHCLEAHPKNMHFKLSFVTSLTFLFLFFVQTSFSQTSPPAPSDRNISAATPTYVFPDAKKRLRRYVNESIGVGALVGTGIGATFAQLDNQPPEWKKTGAGFGRRLASNFGENAIEQATLYGLSEVLRQDPAYQKSDSKKIPNRIGHALKSGFTARTRSGKTVFSPQKVVSPFVANVSAVKLWYPERFTVQDGLRRGSYTFVFNTAFNLFREFVFKKK